MCPRGIRGQGRVGCQGGARKGAYWVAAGFFLGVKSRFAKGTPVGLGGGGDPSFRADWRRLDVRGGDVGEKSNAKNLQNEKKARGFGFVFPSDWNEWGGAVGVWTGGNFCLLRRGLAKKGQTK